MGVYNRTIPVSAMKKPKKKKVNIWKWVLIIAGCLFVIGCIIAVIKGSIDRKNAAAEAEAHPSFTYTDVGEGSAYFILEMYDNDNIATSYVVHTDMEIFADALNTCHIVEYADSNDGKLVPKTVLGYELEEDSSWVLYKDNKLITTPIEELTIDYGFTYQYRMIKNR
ncbi:MAG: hypothetical protein MJ119_05210 [Lachnospiraceae bacterium]|nr:hypothetical protein [Lachnospiraceae bacterium]